MTNEIPFETIKKSEALTRKLLIDEKLEESGWKINDLNKVVLEVDTKNSNFKKADYKTVEDTLKDSEFKTKAYCDYLLLDSTGLPFAVVEAKSASKDWLLGKKQAEEYAEDIRKQTGHPVFIYLTNGTEYRFWNYKETALRKVSGFHSQDDLERIRFQNNNKRPFGELEIRNDIINRPYQNEAITRVLKHIEKGKRKALLVMATGTGKTRVAMALIDMLLRSNRCQRILFLADRRMLMQQAYDKGYMNFFKEEAKAKIYAANPDPTARLYVATIQTMSECFDKFSPGFFDLIISDEAHRSIYNKWKQVFQYFDSLQIGLTATPSEDLEKDTFSFFECEDSLPTFNYAYDEAVAKNWLVPFEVYNARTHFQLKGIKAKDVPDEIKQKLYEQGYDEAEIDFEGTQLEKKVSNRQTNEALVKELMEVCQKDDLGLPAKTIIFAISKKHAAKLRDTFDRLYPDQKSKLVEVIISDDSRAENLKKAFEKENFPRIAISVDMLDTGIDIPEVCNLVFAKPVISKIKFWQMIGRGTRPDEACEHKEWLPNQKKKNFLIIDHWNNFEYHKMHPPEAKETITESIPAQIFRIRLELAKYFYEHGDKENFEKLRGMLIADIKSLPKKNINIREKFYDVDLATKESLWDSVGLDPFEFLKTKISPLMRFKEDVNYDVASFVLKTERLSKALLERDLKQVERLQEKIGETLVRIPLELKKVKPKINYLRKAKSKEFWKSIAYKDTRELQEELAELMRYLRSEPTTLIELELDDVVEERKWDETIFQYGPDGAQEDYVKNYRKKVESYIQDLSDKHPTIKKLKKDEALTEKDMKYLEETLEGPNLYITEDTLQRLYKKHNGSLTQFIKNIVGLYDFPDPKKEVEKYFDIYLKEHPNFNDTQVRFVKALKTVFSNKKHMELKDLFEAPFTNFGAAAPMPLFKEQQLKEMTALCKSLEKKVFADANK